MLQAHVAQLHPVAQTAVEHSPSQDQSAADSGAQREKDRCTASAKRSRMELCKGCRICVVRQTDLHPGDERRESFLQGHIVMPLACSRSRPMRMSS